jgi:hypothetical protein
MVSTVPLVTDQSVSAQLCMLVCQQLIIIHYKLNHKTEFAELLLLGQKKYAKVPIGFIPDIIEDS